MVSLRKSFCVATERMHMCMVVRQMERGTCATCTSCCVTCWGPTSSSTQSIFVRHLSSNHVAAMAPISVESG